MLHSVLILDSQADLLYGMELTGTQSQPAVQQSVGHGGGDLRLQNVLSPGTNAPGSAETYLSGQRPGTRDRSSLFAFEPRSDRRKLARALDSQAQFHSMLGFQPLTFRQAQSSPQTFQAPERVVILIGTFPRPITTIIASRFQNLEIQASPPRPSTPFLST